MAYVIPIATDSNFAAITEEIKKNSTTYRNLLYELWDSDSNLFEYIDRTYPGGEGKKRRERAYCAIIYHVLKRGLSPGEELPCIDDAIASNLEITKAVDPETFDDYAEKIKEHDKGLYEMILSLSSLGKTFTEKKHIFRSTSFVYIALRETLDQLLLNQEAPSSNPFENGDLEDPRLAPFRRYLDGM